MTQVTDLERFATKGEVAVVKRLVRIILERGYMVSINDGEDWTLNLSTDRKEILSALGTTGEDIIRLYKDGERAGSIWLVFGNADDGSELISDHSDNEACLSIWREIYPD